MLVDDWAQGAVGEPVNDRGMDALEFRRWGVPDLHGQDHGVSCHGCGEIDLGEVGAATPDNDDTTVIGQHLQVFVEVDAGEVLNDHVHAPTFGEVLDRLQLVRGGVIEDVVGALLPHQLATLLGSGGPDHRQTEGRGELHRGDTGPPLAPWTSTRSPGTTRALWNKARPAAA